VLLPSYLKGIKGSAKVIRFFFRRRDTESFAKRSQVLTFLHFFITGQQ